MSKKILIILIILILLVGSAYVYFAYFKKAVLPTFQFRAFPTTREIPAERPLLGGPPEIKRGVLSVLVGEPVIGATLSREKNSVLYVVRENGHIYRINFDGQGKTRLSNITIIGAYRAQWSPDTSKIFLAYEQNDTIKKLILDLSTTPPTSSIIPNAIRSVAWALDSKTFYMMEGLTDGVRLIAADALGKKGKELLRIPLGDLNILPYGGPSLFFAEPASAFATGPLFEFNQKNGSFKEIFQGLGLTALVSPKGSNVLLTFFDAQNNMFPLRVAPVNDTAKITALPRTIITLPEKCAWQNEENLFCGIFSQTISGIIMPDSYYKGDTSLTDHLIKINTQTLETTSYEDVVSGFDTQDLFTDEKGENVFFRDAKTDFLYRFSLPE